MKAELTYFRAIEVDDLELLRTWNFDEEVRAGQVASFPVSMGQQKKWYERLQNNPSKVKLIVVDKATDEPIGMVGAMQIDHEAQNCEVGWTIGNKDFWGKGHAMDAAIAFCKFLFEQKNMHLIYVRVLSTNLRAMRFHEKLGFTQTGYFKDFIYKDGTHIDLNILCMLKSDFTKVS